MYYNQPQVARSARPGSEAEVHVMVCDCSRLRYPSAIFRSNAEDGRKRKPWEQQLLKRMNSSLGFPDLFIYEPREGYHGLAIELKAEDVHVRLKDGSISKNPRVQEQYKVLQRLAKRGYATFFASGFNEARGVRRTDRQRRNFL